MRIILIILAIATAFGATAQDNPKNIIMVVGDGMGPAYTTAYRYFADKKDSAVIAETVFDRALVGMASTYPARQSGYVTDSAAGATALSTGVKTYNGAIAVDTDKKPLLTVLEWAKKQGLKTGVAVTSQINHATPAGFTAHNDSRRNYDAIADSYFDDKVDGKFALDVMLGGGWKYFIRDDRNLVDEFKAAGYQYVDTLDALNSAPTGKPLMGLFGDEGMPWALDTPNNLRLPTLAKNAVKHLENDKGFFLLIEGSQVDWAGHANDVSSAMAEMHDLALTLEWLESYVATHPDTLVVVTADHSTGGLSIAANMKYEWNPEPIKGLSASLQTISERMSKSDTPISVAETLLGFSLEADEKAQLSKVDIGDTRAIFRALAHIVDLRTNTGWTTTGHTAVDVQVFAMGKWAEQFAGHVDNTEIPKTVFRLLGK